MTYYTPKLLFTFSKPKPKRRKLLNAEFETLVRSMALGEKGAEQALLEMIQQDPISLTRDTFSILDHKQVAHPLFHFCQFGSLESVMEVYSLYPQAIAQHTKSGYTPHHFAAASRKDDVLRFLVLQHPAALSQSPSILNMLMERIDALPELQFCLSQYPQGLYQTDLEGNSLLHRACRVTNFPYVGPRPQLIKYFVQQYPQAVELPNHEGNLPLHLLLEQHHHAMFAQHSTTTCSTICTKSAMLLLETYPRSAQVPNSAGVMPLELAMDHGGSPSLILALAEPDEALLPSPYPHVIAAHLLQHNPTPHLAVTKVWDSVCPALSKAVAQLLSADDNSTKYKQLSIGYTRLEKTGLAILLGGLERNTEVTCATLPANVGYYASKTMDPTEFWPSLDDHDVHVGGGRLATDSDLSHALEGLLSSNTTLQVLDLSENLLPKDPQWLFGLMRNKTLRSLSLAKCHLGSRVLLSALIPVLRHNKTLRDLNISCPSITQDALVELVSVVLRETRTLRRVVLTSSHSEPILEVSVKTLKENAYLHSILFDLPANNNNNATNSSNNNNNAATNPRIQSLLTQLDYWSRLNRAGRFYARETNARKTTFVTKVLAQQILKTSNGQNHRPDDDAGGDLSILYGLLREAPIDLWSSTPSTAMTSPERTTSSSSSPTHMITDDDK